MKLFRKLPFVVLLSSILASYSAFAATPTVITDGVHWLLTFQFLVDIKILTTTLHPIDGAVMWIVLIVFGQLLFWLLSRIGAPDAVQWTVSVGVPVGIMPFIAQPSIIAFAVSLGSLVSVSIAALPIIGLGFAYFSFREAPGIRLVIFSLLALFLEFLKVTIGGLATGSSSLSSYISATAPKTSYFSGKTIVDFIGAAEGLAVVLAIVALYQTIHYIRYGEAFEDDPTRMPRGAAGSAWGAAKGAHGAYRGWRPWGEKKRIKRIARKLRRRDNRKEGKLIKKIDDGLRLMLRDFLVFRKRGLIDPATHGSVINIAKEVDEAFTEAANHFNTITAEQMRVNTGLNKLFDQLNLGPHEQQKIRAVEEEALQEHIKTGIALRDARDYFRRIRQSKQWGFFESLKAGHLGKDGFVLESGGHPLSLESLEFIGEALERDEMKTREAKAHQLGAEEKLTQLLAFAGSLVE